MPKAQRRAKNTQSEPAPPPPPPVAVAVSPPPSSSDSSGDEHVSTVSELHGTGGMSASRPGSPMQGQDLETEDSVTCQWEDCGKVFTHLPTLIDHIHNEHIGVHKSNYTCEWASCIRRGLPQTSRFALTSHIRSHTGEKPFICPLPECDKSFTRSDALAKHMRLQHNISPPAPGRGGSRKRKRGAGADDQTQGSSTPVTTIAVPLPTVSAFNTFKVEPNTPSEVGNEADSNPDYFNARSGSNATTANGRQKRQPRPSQLQTQHTPSPDDELQPAGTEEDGYLSSASDALPVRLQEQFNDTTGLVLGQTPAKVMYLLMKAKHRYAMQQHEELMEQLKIVKSEMQNEKEEKENALDELLQRMLGPEANQLMPVHTGAEPAPTAPLYSSGYPGIGPSSSSRGDFYAVPQAVMQNGRGK